MAQAETNGIAIELGRDRDPGAPAILLIGGLAPRAHPPNVLSRRPTRYAACLRLGRYRAAKRESM